MATSWIQDGPALAAAFLSSLVELIEALTIVLAAGMARGFRSALTGAFCAALVLVVLTAVLGPAVAHIQVAGLQLVVGVLLLLFGMRWARKAILRSAGLIPLHDEATAFAQQEQALRGPAGRGGWLDWLGFGAAFQGVFIEGIEVVFIVIAVGGAAHNLTAAIVGAGAAALVVTGLGVLVHRPLTRVPENTLKLLVSVMVSSFGTYWIGEGLGIAWPSGEWALLLLTVAYLVVFYLAAGWARRHADARVQEAR